MSTQLSLVVLAAGSSSRYGLLKQTELFGDAKLTIAEYNILDAIKNGVNNIIFVIQEQTADIFHRRLSHILPDESTFSLIYQDPEHKLCKFCKRTKLWGTGHAVLSAMHCLKGNFLVMNADDLYGENAIKTAISFLKEVDPKESCFSAIGYKLSDTLSNNGTVSRGIIYTTGEHLNKIVEYKGISRNDNEEIVDESGNIFPKNTLVSMNLWGFTPEIFHILKEEWQKFTKNISDPLNEEFYLPVAITNAISKKKCTVQILPTTSIWHGITYQNDRKTLEKWLKIKKQQ